MSVSKRIILPSVVLALLGGAAIQQTTSATTVQQNIADLSSQAINQVKISNNTDNIYIKTGEKLSVDYDGPKDSAPIVQVKDNCLELTPRHRFSFNFFSRNTYTITITLPQAKLQSFSIDSSNGDVKVDKIYADKGHISTSNGDIIISNLISQFGFELSSSNGDIVVEHNNASGYDFSNSNGTNTFENTTVSNSFAKMHSKNNVLEINNSNGDIVIN
ncbi:lipoprotein [Lactobacillus pasteurii DSM 23907 = CRBIP 24.76]|uniref:Putative lipoprotein n=1 Tax=Lactobacillus pasteurii DSM 23907 = CRBIP 24.76 TaxID=1423790 RepID=I7KKY3_9LACO|nr:DUF4097 family beta strand repeat-containing protein [Lactobacillus pasteurii]KRK08244.1 lipoprotein [Lactobacillus pasteurii DSM 23907 = CRBIP 24.76]TDG77364.1 hypothetical protein C5L33_000807 [Lactobacillus pasteurii]CCI84909.1 Putative lipoprotein [Lactobacillus pasteurii DSM 23907 = CRBIP 24.76]